MRFLTIRAKVTLWYTAFMILLVAIMLGLLMKISNTTVLTNYTQKLLKVMDDVAEDVEEEEEVDYFDEGVYIIEYDDEGRYMVGTVPTEFPIDLTLRDRKVQEVTEGDYIFYTYDRRVVTEQGSVRWMRGVIGEAKGNQLNSIIVGTAFILLPILVLLSSIMGYFITKRAFKPIRQIQETAQKITESKALSMRIGLPKGKDEISKLGQTIDGMLEQLERSFEKEKQFISDASHELRTPIAVILNESEYGMEHLEDLEEAKESMEVINRQANRMTKLINQLLFFARADEESITLQYEALDVAALMSEMIEDRKILNHSAHIIFKNEIQGNSTYWIDRTLFFRALQNLIQNAVVYSKPSGQEQKYTISNKMDDVNQVQNTSSGFAEGEEVEVQVRLYEEGHYFVVEVKDYGIGISPEDLERIWDRFYQVNPSRNKKNSESMGLGLAMVKWIAKKHGGFVKVESVLNKGSTFSLYFPNKKGDF